MSRTFCGFCYTIPLRFTRSEFGAYLGGVLPPKRLRALWEESHGWPIAVCLQRNLAELDEIEVGDLSANWVASRLVRGVAERDHRFLLEAACFEWADAEMFDEVLGSGSAERLQRLGILRGLVQGIDGGTTFRLHPLIRRYAESELRRFGGGGELRRRIAVALAARGRTIDAMRQALEANDTGLAAEILQGAGAVRLTLTAGLRGLQDAVALLPDDALHSFPRLRLARSAAAAMDQRIFEPEVAGSFQSLADGETVALRVGDDDGEVQIDDLIVRGIFLLCGCVPIGSDAMRSAVAEGDRAVARPGFDPVAAGGILYGQSVYYYEAGDLGTALARAHRVRELAGTCPSVALSAWILQGAILFAGGDVAASDAALIQAARQAEQHFAGHESPELIGNAFAAEVAIETNRPVAGRRVPAFAKLTTVGAWLDVYAAVVDVGIELALRRNAPAQVWRLLKEAWEFAQRRRLATFCRWLAAMRVSALAREGRLDEATALWRETGLPTDLEGHLDMAQQSWREMEAICCARLRLLLAGRDHAEALAFAQSFAKRARAKGLARTETWANAFAMHAAWRAGDARAAEKYLLENLRLFQRTGFSRAFTTRPEATGAVLERLDTADADLNSARQAVRALIGTQAADSDAAALTQRELEILAGLADSRDKEIARALGLTDNGVRYHVRNIFAKLGVSDRHEAVRKARQIGALPAADASSARPAAPSVGSWG
ncbi:MAG: LuxR C-terminal-related transcriptional regulator [Gammaproteobacteria bacterium]|nr:LuxR C-terminal-related transcriptional regulator [Gammaproteobacteria bacterium]